MNAIDRSHAFEIGRSFEGVGYTIKCVDYLPGYQREPHSHERDGITLVLGGEMRERVGRVEEDASSLSVVVKPAGTVHTNDVGPSGARTIGIELDTRAALYEYGALGEWRWSHQSYGVRPILALGRSLCEPDEVADREDLLFELLDEITENRTNSESVPSWVRKARETLDDQAPEGVEVRKLAAELGVHPVSLTRAFRRAYGVSVSTYRRQVRVRHAVSHVVRKKESLASIAYGAGFSDQPHMCREIRSMTGLSPTKLRQLAHS